MIFKLLRNKRLIYWTERQLIFIIGCATSRFQYRILCDLVNFAETKGFVEEGKKVLNSFFLCRSTMDSIEEIDNGKKYAIDVVFCCAFVKSSIEFVQHLVGKNGIGTVDFVWIGTVDFV